MDSLRHHGHPSRDDFSAERRGVERTDFQRRVTDWVVTCFGGVRAIEPLERAQRMLEEALELAQACGCTEGDAHKLAEYVFARPPGSVQEEVGGVMVTVAALCGAVSVDMAAAGETELDRDWTRIDEIRAKAEGRPPGTPLP